MTLQSNLRRSRRPNQPRGVNVDGFITPDRFKGEGNLTPKPHHSDKAPGPNSIDNFNRPDGYHPAAPAMAGSDAAVTTAVLPGGPRQRHAHASDMPVPIAGKKTKRSRPWKKIAKWTALIIIFIAVVLGGFVGWKFARNTTKVFHGSILGIFKTTKLKGEDKGRVTILLAGNSADDPGHDGANLTDSILLISIDTVHNTGFMLSIPRDLWVSYGTQDCIFGNSGKINATYECGQDIKFNQPGFPQGGMGLLEKNIEQDFGVDINYYALIDYSALRDAVNAVGGVNFTVKSQDPRGIYDPSIDYSTRGPLVKLTNGTHVLNGQQALDLARARGDAYGAYGYPSADFTRTQNQRQLLLALKDKALSAGVLSNPAKITSLFDAIGNNVKTDFHTDEVRRLYDISKKISNNNVKSVGLADTNVNLVTTGSINNVSAVMPRAGIGNYTAIQAFIKRLISNDPVAKEGAKAVVLNGSGIGGLAAKESTVLAAKGITVSAVANTTSQSSTAVIALNPKMTATKAYLEQAFGVTALTSASSYPAAQNYQADFVIILGANANTNPQ
ncbi:MAG TPA: LCP family protein [Patescibacteria group bacterium]|nr:LCP family protein [Patescibacteria group bacterium]